MAGDLYVHIITPVWAIVKTGMVDPVELIFVG